MGAALLDLHGGRPRARRPWAGEGAPRPAEALPPPPRSRPASRPASRPGALAGGAGRAAPPLRLTRRGRAAAVAAAVLLLGAAGSCARAAALPDDPVRAVVVRPGDTLWQLARGLAPQEDPRATLHAIRALNGWDAVPVLRPGAVVLVPAAG